MKIKVKKILRGAEITADPGDTLVVDDKIGTLLINADAAEEIIETKEELNTDMKLQSKETPKKKR